MELKRILAKDSRSAMEMATSLYGKDVLVVSSQSVAGQVELVVAMDIQPEPPPAVGVALDSAADTPKASAFTEAFRRALGPMPEPEPVVVAAEPVPAAAPIVQAEAAVAQPALILRPEPAPTVQAPTSNAEQEALRARDIVDVVRREIAALRQEFQISRQVQAWQSGQPMSQALSPVVAALNEAGVPAGLRALLIDSAQQAADAGAALESMRLLMGDALGALPKVRIERGVHAVCGSSGAGKTLMVTRLAFDAAQRLGAQRVALVVFDDTRPGAWSQMQVLAAQAGVSCFRAPDADTLRLLLNELGSRDLVLVDTAGGDAWAQAQRLQATGLELQVHALVPADASIASVRRVLADGSRWSSVMVSKLDECESSWPLMQALCDRQLPVSCTAASAQPQDAARPFDAQRLVKPAFKRLQADMAPAVIAMAPDAEAVHVPAKAPLKVSAKMPAKAKVGPEAPAVVTVKASARRAAAPALVKPAARGAASRAAA